MKTKHFVLYGLAVVGMYLIIGTLFDGNHVMLIPLFLASVFGLTIFAFKKKADVSLVQCLMISLPFWLIMLVTGYFVENFSRVIPYLIFVPVSSMLAFLYLKTKKILIIPVALILFYCVGNYFFISMFTYLSNVDAEKNIDLPKINLVNSKNEEIDLHRDKIIVLDFWSTSCGICFEEFPEFESVYEKYKANREVEIYAVNYPLKRDKFEQTIKILDSIGYKFPKLYAKSAKQIEDSLHFNTFPHLIIVKNGKIRYDGMFETERNTMIYSIESEIETLLNE